MTRQKFVFSHFRWGSGGNSSKKSLT